jgi:hypothetical protein
MAGTQVVRTAIYPTEITRILKMPGGPVGVEIRRFALGAAAIAEASARRELGNRHPADAPRSGRYARSFEVKVENYPADNIGFQYVIRNRAPYSAVLEFGSRRHDIYAKRVYGGKGKGAKLLRFRSRKDGQWRAVFAVDHPGQRTGYYILWRAVNAALSIFRMR